MEEDEVGNAYTVSVGDQLLANVEKLPEIVVEVAEASEAYVGAIHQVAVSEAVVGADGVVATGNVVSGALDTGAATTISTTEYPSLAGGLG